MLSILFLKPDLTFFSQQSLDVFGNASLKTLSLMAFLTHYTAWIVSGQTINSMLALCDNTSSRLFSQYTSQHKSFYFFNVLYSPQNCVGFLFLDLHPPCPPRRRVLRVVASSASSSSSLSHTIFHTHTHTHIFVTPHLSHTSLSHTVFHAGVALGDIDLRFAWPARHLETPAFVSHGRCGTWRHPPSFCVAGVALTGLGWVWWRAWVRLVARDAAALLRGRRGTWRHRPAFCVAGMVLGDIHRRFAWQAWHLRGWAGSGGALGSAWSPVTPRHFCVAGVVLGDIDLRFAWQAWYLATSTVVLRGRRWKNLRIWLVGFSGLLIPNSCAQDTVALPRDVSTFRTSGRLVLSSVGDIFFGLAYRFGFSWISQASTIRNHTQPYANFSKEV